jgi:hypothetical protein
LHPAAVLERATLRRDSLLNEGSFRATDRRYTAVDQVHITDLRRWLAKSREIQWDSKNLAKRKGKLERLK